MGKARKDALRLESALKLKLEFHKTMVSGGIGINF